MKLSFHGAARSVTGSRHMLEIPGFKLLLDCGLFQGRRDEAYRQNRDLGFDPKSLNAVLLSHAHIDHSGALPVLQKHGFSGKVPEWSIWAWESKTALSDLGSKPKSRFCR